MKEHQAHQITFSIIGALCVVAILYFTWAVFIDGRVVRHPIDIYGDIEVEHAVYSPGDVVYGTIELCKKRNIEATFQWNLVDTYIKIYPKRTARLGVGCYKALMEIEKIPADQRPGPVYFDTILEYKINAYNTVTVPLRTNKFTVL